MTKQIFTFRDSAKAPKSVVGSSSWPVAVREITSHYAKVQLVLRDFLYEETHGPSGIRDSAVSPVNMRQPGATDFSFLFKTFRPALWPRIPWVPVVKWPRCEVDPSLPSSAVKNKWRYISTAIMVPGLSRG